MPLFDVRSFLPWLVWLGVFWVLLFVIGVGVLARCRLETVEKLAAAPAVAMTVLFGLGWVIYLTGGGPAWSFLLVPIATGAVLAGWAEWRRIWADSEARSLLLVATVLLAWCAGWLCFVRVSTGGLWANDWLEHYKRVLFFSQRWPLDFQFLGLYSVAARPPLTNVAAGQLMALSSFSFPYFQACFLVFSVSAFLPLQLLWRRWGGGGAGWILAAICATSPLFLHNATFAWTKLPAACFTLLGLHWLVRGLPEAGSLRVVLAFVTLALGFLVHYSVAVPGVVLAAFYLWRRNRLVGRAGLLRETGLIVLVCIGVIAVWLGWALATLGVREALGSNTTVTEVRSASGVVVTFLLNLRDSIIPFSFRDVPIELLAQGNFWARWRDWFFYHYQTILPLALGSGGTIALVVLAIRKWRGPDMRVDSGWAAVVVGWIALGIGVHTGRSEWGLVHICLQPVVLLGLAWLAANVGGLRQWWGGLLAVGCLFDLTVGIVLHFHVQSFDLSVVADPFGPAAAAEFGTVTMVNECNRRMLSATFLGTWAQPYWWWIGAVLVGLAGVIAWGVRRDLKMIGASMELRSGSVERRA